MHSRACRFGLGGGVLLRLSVALLSAGAGCREPTSYAIGVVLGGEGVRGAELAVATLNNAGGIRGHPLVLKNLGGDRNSNAGAAIRVAEQMVADPQVLAVVGHANSSASLAASQVYNARHVVQIAPTTTAPVYSQAGPWSFRLVASDEHQAAFIVRQLLAGGRAPRTALVYVNDDYGRPLRQLLLQEMRARGIPVVYEGPYDEGEAALSETDIVRSLAAARPEVLIWAGRTGGYLAVSEMLHKSLPGIQVLASDGFGGAAVEEDPLHRFDGVRYVRLVDLRRPDSTLQSVRNRYRADGGADLSDQAALAYDAVMLIAEAARQVGPRREAIRDWVSHVGRDRPALQGITGPIGFPEGGDRKPTYVLTTVGASAPRRTP